MSLVNSNNIPQFLATLVGQFIQFRDKEYIVFDWEREETFARISTNTGFLQIPYQYVKEIKVLDKEVPADAAPSRVLPSKLPINKPESEPVANMPAKVEEPAESPSEVVVRENNPGLMFQELADFGMDTLRKLKSKNLKAEEAQTIFAGMEAMVKVGTLQIRAYEVMKDMGKNTPNPKK